MVNPLPIRWGRYPNALPGRARFAARVSLRQGSLRQWIKVLALAGTENERRHRARA